MNRRSFLAGLGAAMATFAVVTKLGIPELPKLRETSPLWTGKIGRYEGITIYPDGRVKL